MFDMYKSIGNTVNALNSALRIAISNADNFNTPGFKYTYASFTSMVNEVVSSGTEKTNPLELGGSMTLGSTSTDFAQGNLSFGTNLDVAVVGEGFFALSDSPLDFGSNSNKVYTRSGKFQVDFQNKYLTDAFGRKVYGYKLDTAGNIIDHNLVPIETNSETDIGFIDGGILVSNYQKRKDDIAAGSASPAENVPLYRLALTSFQNKQGLITVEGAAFRGTPASGEPLSFGAATEGSYGNIKASTLESSNIDVAKIALDMALLNRGFSAVQGMIDDLNKIMSGLISKLQ